VKLYLGFIARSILVTLHTTTHIPALTLSASTDSSHLLA